MSLTQLVLAHANKVVMLVLLAGMIYRGRIGQCWSFAAYVAAAIVGNALSSFWPERFYTPWFFMLKQGVYDVLKLAIGLELAYRAFAAFPGVWRTARVVYPILLALTTLALGWLTPRGSFDKLWEWQPSVMTAAVWLLTATALLVTWYHLPIIEWQRVIMLGFAPYLLTYATTLRLFQRRGWILPAFGVWDSMAWLALVSFWAYAAWRREKKTDDSPPLEMVTADV
jgi:hypothetical protein